MAKHKTDNFKNYISTNINNLNSKRTWQTFKRLHNSQNNSPPQNEALKNNKNTLPSTKEQSNILAKHYAKTTRKPTHNNNRKIIRKLKNTPLENNPAPPFTTQDTASLITTLKNSPATGSDNISNLHIKHLGPSAIHYLTDIFNKSWTFNYMPDSWKKAIIIPKLKPRKDPTLPSSYRPISLLSCLSKLMEKIILSKIRPHIQTSQHQHGFKKSHSTSTALTNISQHITNGLNQSPSQRSFLIAIDISKAFDTVPRHILIQKILNSPLSNNYKKWLSNFISNRTSQVTIKNKLSKNVKLTNGVPQGAILSPTLFNLFTLDLPIPHSPNSKLITYADDITIVTQNTSIPINTLDTQSYITQLELWLTSNRMSASAEKSSITLITTDRHQSSEHPQITLNNNIIPLNKTPKILGLTYDTHFTFTPHTQNIISSANRKLNVIRSLSSNNFSNEITTLSLFYKQFIRTNLNYASTAWYPLTSTSNRDKLQIIQNKALRIITGCLTTTHIQHLHDETKILPIKNHLDMIGTQYYALSRNPLQPSHHDLENPTRQRLKSPPS